MAIKRPFFGLLVPQLQEALQVFQASPSKFRVLRTVASHDLTPKEPSRPSSADSPKTLFILDSSFNPPSIAHQTLAQSALRSDSSSKHPAPHRLLLLFATMNADKAPSAASFDQRLTLMTIFATDLLESMKGKPQEYPITSVDIGVTKDPYYTDKSAAIENEGREWYPDVPKHVHLVGYDTLTRFFAAKYYEDFNPPFSALNPYFDHGHQLRVTLRPDSEYGTVDEQKAFVKQLEDGGLEADGGKKEWARQLQLVPPNEKAGVSSTKIRKAAKAGEWELVRSLCTPSVAEWVRSERIYEDDASGAKMA
ncbi:Nicotinamide mononucleotide adenylyltransferase [Teratosphaeria destructans]|uniref:Nicotinamide mononucleotide adenylyltransferase n=1 Tax=Teratosphaeria destructans TaxID=418781 RepID=A0A9W7SWG8_9PEZI|nr:Nicotinamide mononucleotide adenylyltransferase [Teratosphaeria destructans]